LTYEEKWMVYHAFESFERNKSDGSVIVVDDPYSVTSAYIGVARTTVANIVTSVRESGRVPQLTLPGNRHQMTAIPIATEARIREFVFERHREGVICNAKHIVALLKDECALDMQDRTMRRHLARMGFVWSHTKKQTRSLRESSRVRQQRHIGKYLSSFPILVGVSKFCIISEFKDWFESESRAPGALITSGMSPLSVYSQISDERFKGPTQPGSIAMA
jgi:transposase